MSGFGDNQQSVPVITGISRAEFNQHLADNASLRINVLYPPIPLVQAKVNDIAFDNGPIIQALDSYIATYGGQLDFPSGIYNFDTKCSKSPYTTWRGKISSQDQEYGTILFTDDDITLIELDYGGSVKYGFNSGIKKIGLMGNILTTANSIGLNHIGGIRQQVYEDLYIRYFKTGTFLSGGEYYFNRVFISNCKYSFSADGLADSWFYACHGGSGLTANAICSGGVGFNMLDCTNLRFTDCRAQVQLGGSGIVLNGCDNIRITSPTIDQNEGHGIQIIDSSRVQLIAPEIFDNGTTSVQKAGVSIFATDGNVCERISIIGGCLTDRNFGTVDEKQNVGVNLTLVGTGVLRDITILGVDLNDIDTPIKNPQNVASGLKVEGCNNVSKFIYYDSLSASVNIANNKVNKYHKFNNPLTFNITVTLPVGYNGEDFIISRGASASGSFDIIINKNDGAELTRLTTVSTGVHVIWDNLNRWIVLNKLTF